MPAGCQRLRRPRGCRSGIGSGGRGGEIAGVDLFAVDGRLVAVGLGITAVLAGVAAVAEGVVAVAPARAAVPGHGLVVTLQFPDGVVEVVEEGVEGLPVQAGEGALLGDERVQPRQRRGREVGPVGGVERAVLDTGQPLQDLQAEPLEAVGEVLGVDLGRGEALLGVDRCRRPVVAFQASRSRSPSRALPPSLQHLQEPNPSRNCHPSSESTGSFTWRGGFALH